MMARVAPRQASRAPAELDDVTLARARRGDDDACRALVARYQRPVFALLSRMLPGEAALVEDLAQETFLRVFAALPGFQVTGPARCSTWILTIATRLALDEKRRKRRLDIPLEDATEPEARERADAVTQRRQAGDALRAALATLPEEQQAAFLLRAYHGLSYDEIGAVLDCDAGTVSSRLSRAKAALKARIHEVVHG